MKVLILRSINFSDDIENSLINELVSSYETNGCEVAVYNMPESNDITHWAGFTIADFSNRCDIMICIDFPTALIYHENKRIILTKPLPEDECFKLAISEAISEAQDCFKFGNINIQCDVFPVSMNDYIEKGGFGK